MYVSITCNSEAPCSNWNNAHHMSNAKSNICICKYFALARAVHRRQHPCPDAYGFDKKQRRSRRSISKYSNIILFCQEDEAGK